MMTTDLHCPPFLMESSTLSSTSTSVSVGVLDSSYANEDHDVPIEATGVGALEPHMHHSPSRKAAATRTQHENAVSTFTFDTIPDMIHAAILSYPLKTAPLSYIIHFAEKQALASKNEANSVLMINTLKNWETAVTNCLSLCDRFAQVGEDLWTVKSLGQQTASLVQCPYEGVEPDPAMLGKHCASAAPPPSSPVAPHPAQFDDLSQSRPDSPEHHPFRVDHSTNDSNSSGKKHTTTTTPYKTKQKYAAVLAMLSQQPSLDKTIAACDQMLSSESLSPSIVPTVLKMKEDAQAYAKLPALDLDTGKLVSSQADELPFGSTVIELTSKKTAFEQGLQQSPRAARRAQKLSQRTAATALALLGKRRRDDGGSDSDEDSEEFESDAAFFDDDEDEEEECPAEQIILSTVRPQKRMLPARAKRASIYEDEDMMFSSDFDDDDDASEDESEIDHDGDGQIPRSRRYRAGGSDNESINAAADDGDDEYRPSSVRNSSRKKRKTVASSHIHSNDSAAITDENTHSDNETHDSTSGSKKRARKSGTSKRRSSDSKFVKTLTRGNSSVLEVRDLSPGDSDDSSNSQVGVSLISDGSKPGHRLLQVKLKGNKRETIEVDENGQPTQVLHLGTSLTIHGLGRIIQNKPAFHNDRYIFPAGFKSSRQYFSTVNPDQKVLYYSEIIDGGDAPEFKVTAEDDMEHPILSNTCTGAWTVVVRKVNEARGKKGKRMFTTVSGPEMFGLSTTLVSQLICHLPGADSCKQYRYRERKR